MWPTYVSKIKAYVYFSTAILNAIVGIRFMYFIQSQNLNLISFSMIATTCFCISPTINLGIECFKIWKKIGRHFFLYIYYAHFMCRDVLVISHHIITPFSSLLSLFLSCVTIMCGC